MQVSRRSTSHFSLSIFRLCKFLLLLVILVLVYGCQHIEKEFAVTSTLRAEEPYELNERNSSNLFSKIRVDPKNDRVWQALYKYSLLADTSIASIFHRDCFEAIKENHLIFFERYMSGDENSINLMMDAFLYDYQAFSLDGYDQTNRVYQYVLDSISAEVQKYSLNVDSYSRASAFRRISEGQHILWQLRYCKKLEMKRGKVVTDDCPA